MSVSPMKAISIIGLLPDLDKVIKACGSSAVFQPDEVTSFYSDTRNFVHITDKNPYTEQLDELYETLSAAGAEPELTNIEKFEPSQSQISDFVSNCVSKLDVMISETVTKQQLLEKLKTSAAQAEHFIGYNFPMDKINACKFIKVNFGRLPADSYTKLQDYKDNPYVAFFPSTQDDKFYWGVYVAPIAQSADIDRIFSGLYFERCDVSDIDTTPEKYLETLTSRTAEIEKQLESAKQKMQKFLDDNEKDCLLYYTKLTQLVTYYNIKTSVMKYDKSFVLVGWIPAENEESFG